MVISNFQKFFTLKIISNLSATAVNKIFDQDQKSYKMIT